MATPIPADQFQSPFPPPLPLPPLPPPGPPATPGFQNTGLSYSLLQELVLSGSYREAADRCRPLSSSIHPSYESGATALVDAPPACGQVFFVISCGYTAPPFVIEKFNKWVATGPLGANPDACLPMRLVSWSNDDLRGEAHSADSQNRHCGTFYANICEQDSDTLLSLVDTPPNAPPPPIAPDADLTPLTVATVMAKGGLAAGATAARCTDAANTECAAGDADAPWLLFDLGAQQSSLYSARIHFVQPADPSAAALELWVSRHLATFGTRAATISAATVQTEASVTVRLTEDDTLAEGRYVYVRSFAAQVLRIDGAEFFAGPSTGRRLGGAPKRDNLDTGPKRPSVPAFSWQRVWQMRNLTMVTCLNETNAPEHAKDARQQAAMLWAELPEPESAVACMSCVTHLPGNCSSWFRQPHGYRGADTMAKEKKRRQMREQLDRDEPERVRRLSEALAQSCCRVHKATGKKECGKQFCPKVFKQQAEKRMAHVLREMHDRPHVKTTLSVPQLVSTDMVAPHLHHDERCQTEQKRDAHGHIECVASSLIKHFVEKHGFSEADINKRMDRYGITIADIITAQLRHSTGGGAKKKTEYKSDPKAADAAATARRAEKARRQLDSLEAKPPAKRTKAPRASWIKRSTRAGRRLAEAAKAPGVEALALSGKDLRARRREHDEFVRNQSCAAKDIMRAANLAAATTGARPATMGNLMSAAWDASVATDGSLLGRTRTVVNAFGRIGETATHIVNTVEEARRQAPPPPPPKKRRQLTASEEAYFAKVDDMVGAVGRGFKVPDHVDEQWGWVSDAADWSWWWDEAHRVGNILYNRHDWVHRHAEDTGTLPVGKLPDEHKTGYGMLDINAPPSLVGSWLRSKVGGGRRHEPHRRLHEKRKLHELPRAEPPEEHVGTSVVGAFADAAVNDHDPLDAMLDALHYNDHRTSMRRLLELPQWMSMETVDAAFDTAAAYAERLAPVVFGPSTGEMPGEVNMPGQAALDPLRQVVRFIAYDSLLCYLYPPNHMGGSPMGDGSPIQLHYSNRACFPMIPWLPPDMKTFNDAFSLGESFEWDSLEYENACDSSAVKVLIGPMMGDLSTIGFVSAPYSSILRFAEGVDSIRNFAKVGDATLTETQRASAIVCAIAQLGGVIWAAVFILFLGVFCICAPVGGWCCLRCYRVCRGKSRRDRRRDAAVDELLYEYADYGAQAGPSSAIGKATVRRRQKMGPTGHFLLPGAAEQ